MKIKRKLGNRGRIVIPKVIRDKFGINRETGIIFEVKGNKEVYIRAG